MQSMLFFYSSCFFEIEGSCIIVLAEIHYTRTFDFKKSKKSEKSNNYNRLFDFRHKKINYSGHNKEINY